MKQPAEKKIHPYRIQIAGIVVLIVSLILALVAASCGVTPSAAMTGVPTREPEPTPSPLATITPSSSAIALPTVTSAPTPTATTATPTAGRAGAGAEISVSVQDFNALAIKGYAGQSYSLLTVTPSGGSPIEMKYEGVWFSEVSTGDLDGDGSADIVLYLEHAGSSHYGIGEAHVLRIEHGALVEYPNKYLPNPDVALDCPSSYATQKTGPFRVLCGACVQTADGRDLLRVRHWLLDSGDDAVLYTDAFFNGKGWQIEDAGMLSGKQPVAEPTDAAGELPVVHRDGFKEAELTFVLNSVSPKSDGIDPDEPYYYDADHQILMPSLRESAQDALRQLYDMTGYLVEQCNVLSTGRDLLFSMGQDFNLGSFFDYSISPALKGEERLWCMNISYYSATSPIHSSQIAAPSNLTDLSDEEVAKWYYEHSAFGDRRRVVGTEPDHVGFIRLYLENGDFYEATLHPGTRAIESLYGPYEKGFEH